MKTTFTYLICPFSFFLLSHFIFPTESFAQAGRLDSSFGVNGIVQNNLLGDENNSSNTVLLQNDGKIVVCGDNGIQGLLLRYNLNGSLDSAFGRNGIVQSPAYTFMQAALQQNGKIIVAADSTNSFPVRQFGELICYNKDGSPDSSFGNKGVVILDSVAYFVSMLIEKSGKILLINSNSSETAFRVSRYLTNGQLDSSFNHTGFLYLDYRNGNYPLVGLQSGDRIVLTFPNFPGDSIIRYDSTGKQDTTFKFNNLAYSFVSLIVQRDDKIILGRTIYGDSAWAFSCLRTNADGSLDTTFNHTGIDTIYTQQPEIVLYAMALDQNNNILLSGTYGVNDYYTNFFTTIRILSDGKHDMSFGANGEADLQIGESHDYPYSVAVQSDNKILITGTSEVHIYHYGNHIATVRYNVNGSIDRSFGTGGVDTPHIFTQTLSLVASMLSEGDGKILIGAIGFTSDGVSDNALIRYNEDGTIDSSFNNGKPLQAILHGIPSIAIVNEKILEIYVSDSLRIFKYNLDGSVDNSFGKNGRTSTFINKNIEWFGYDGFNTTPVPLVIQPDGKMIISGFSGSFPNDYADVVKLNADGKVDSSFGTNGISEVQFQYFSDKFSLAQQPDGKILLGAGQNLGSYYYQPFYLFRFNTNGSLDSSFGTNGLAMKLIDSMHTAKEASFILLQPDGKILQVGSLVGNDSTGIVAIRYTINGNIDSTFGENGIVKSYITGGGDYANSGILQPDGKILITGKAFDGGDAYFSILIRYLPNGTLDSSFGTSGIIILATIPPARYYDPGNIANGIILQSDKILIAGYNNYLSETDLYIARFINDVTLGIINFSSPNNTTLVYPNPIHQSATLKYTLIESENITINLFDITGKLVQTFVANHNESKGNYSEQLNFNSSLAAGNYFLTIGNGRVKETVKIIKQ